MKRSAAASLLATVLLALAACGDDPATTTTADPPKTSTTGNAAGEPADLAEARTRWEAAGIDDYDWHVASQCFCPAAGVSVSVRDGVVVDLRPDGDGVVDDLVPVTVEALFDEIERATATADEVIADYDPDTGRPLSVQVDAIRNAVDDEYAITTDSFEPTEAEQPVVTVGTNPGAAPELTESYACGFGFQVADADQTAALFVAYAGDASTDPAEGPIDGTTWSGELRLGADLLSNWCDDVITPDEPTPRVDETLEVVAGEVTITEILGGAVHATLTGVVAERPDGSTLELGDLDVVNDCWGCAAG